MRLRCQKERLRCFVRGVRVRAELLAECLLPFRGGPFRLSPCLGASRIRPMGERLSEISIASSIEIFQSKIKYSSVIMIKTKLKQRNAVKLQRCWAFCHFLKTLTKTDWISSAVTSEKSRQILKNMKKCHCCISGFYIENVNVCLKFAEMLRLERCTGMWIW